MGGKEGRFVKGAWTEGEETSAPEAGSGDDPMAERVDQAGAQLRTTLFSVASLARDLLATPDGRAYIQKRVEQAAGELEAAIRDAVDAEPPGAAEKKPEKAEGK
jgi:hypothetical protein